MIENNVNDAISGTNTPPANNRRISDIATEIVPATIPPTKNVLEETRTLVNANLI